MKQFIHLVLLFVLGLSLSVTKGQIVIESFDTDLSADSTYDLNIEGEPSRIDYTLNTSDFKEGTGSGHVNYVLGAFHQWGTYAQLVKTIPDGETPFDWSISDSVSIWIKVVQAPTVPANMVFRIHIKDRPNDTDPIEEYIYENTTVLDAVHDWYELKIPLFQRAQNEAQDLIPDSTGFILSPAGWGGFTYNNKKLDFDKIVGYNISAITTGWDAANNLPADSVVVLLDAFTRFGAKAIPAIIFNGVALGPYIDGAPWSWGQSSLGVEEGAGPVANSNALKWVQGDEYGNGWTGVGVNVNPPFNLSGAWAKDTMQFKLKAESGVGELRLQLEDGTAGGKRGWNFTPTDDNQWHTYKVALQDLIYPPGENPANYGPIDSSHISVVGMMAEASGIAGKVIYITDWWTGNPEFDVIPPDAPQNVQAFAGSDKTNSIIWDDVPGEEGEKYDVYYSVNPITDLKADGVETVALNIPENNAAATHVLLAPATDQDVTYYYAVTCTDASGNKSAISVNAGPLTNTAKGVTTITMDAPTNFVADGDLSEWQSMTHFRMYPSDGSGHVVTNSTIDGDADCSANVWVGMDATYLYVAFDIFDDVFTPDISTSNWLNDAPDLFIGLYNYHGISHTGYKRGAEPDYHFRFTYNKAVLDNPGATVDTLDSGNYYYGEAFGSGYRVEFRVKWTDLAAFGKDNVFTPVNGFRIPIDFEINDADGAEREGMLTYAISEDKSYQDVSRWTYTWIGDQWNPTGVENQGLQTVVDYNLAQNYPNPFNPSTQIKFSIKETGMVTLKVFDVLGREVATLVNNQLATGSYTVNFNASGLASGIYFYRLESGSFVQTNKMMLLK
jgi:hypothetical protein